VALVAHGVPDDVVPARELRVALDHDADGDELLADAGPDAVELHAQRGELCIPAAHRRS
jgi:hypothetical protein